MQRNCLFRNANVHSLDEYGPYSPNRAYDIEKTLPYRSRFDNSSFIRNLNSSISQTSVDSGHNTGGSTTSSNNSKEKLTSKQHHHSSIHEMIKQIGKKVHIWPRNRHESINEHGGVSSSISASCADERERPSVLGTINGKPIVNENEDIDNFRMRSKSLDVNYTRKLMDDCESTYKIYNTILKEGNVLNLSGEGRKITFKGMEKIEIYLKGGKFSIYKVGRVNLILKK